MSEQLAVFTALRAIRGGLDEWEEVNLRVKEPDEILSKYLEWASTELVDGTISVLTNMENHSIAKLVAESYLSEYNTGRAESSYEQKDTQECLPYVRHEDFWNS